MDAGGTSNDAANSAVTERSRPARISSSPNEAANAAWWATAAVALGGASNDAPKPAEASVTCSVTSGAADDGTALLFVRALSADMRSEWGSASGGATPATTQRLIRTQQQRNSERFSLSSPSMSASVQIALSVSMASPDLWSAA